MLQGISSAGIAGYTRVASRPHFGGGFQTAVAGDRFEMSSSPALTAQERSPRSRSEVLGKLKQFSSTPDELPTQSSPQPSGSPVGEQLGWLLAGHPTW